jgi:hypothetical protein
MRRSFRSLAQVFPLFLSACSSSSVEPPKSVDDAAGDAGSADAVDAVEPREAGGDAAADVEPRDGAITTAEGDAARVDRFVTKVVSFTPGPCAGYGAARMPAVVLGPPVGAGDAQGGTDVVSLGTGGEIVVSFEPNAIVDGPGVDLLVFENAFFAGGDAHAVAADRGEVSVSDDGLTWTTFPCTATAYPYGACAGWHPVYSSPMNGISPLDAKVDANGAGGDPFDLHDVGVTRARFVRVRDLSVQTCSSESKITTNGFDLDAMAIINAETL